MVPDKVNVSDEQPGHRVSVGHGDESQPACCVKGPEYTVQNACCFLMHIYTHTHRETETDSRCVLLVGMSINTRPKTFTNTLTLKGCCLREMKNVLNLHKCSR